MSSSLSHVCSRLRRPTASEADPTSNSNCTPSHTHTHRDRQTERWRIQKPCGSPVPRRRRRWRHHADAGRRRHEKASRMQSGWFGRTVGRTDGRGYNASLMNYSTVVSSIVVAGCRSLNRPPHSTRSSPSSFSMRRPEGSSVADDKFEQCASATVTDADCVAPDGDLMG